VKKRTRIAIACQGGGSHAAFTAGVLAALFRDAEFLKRYEVVALSGTSGGAVCAALAWTRLVRKDYEGAARALEEFWDDLACYDWLDLCKNWVDPTSHRRYLPWVELGESWWNVVGQLAMSVAPGMECDIPAFAEWTRYRMERLLVRHLDVQGARKRLKAGFSGPELFIGTTDICRGQGCIFTPGQDVSGLVDAVLASVSVPPLFPVASLEGRYCWDGLFSLNPPLEELAAMEPKGPEEIWVIQINPEEVEGPPQSFAEIVDRRNELSGNLSLGEEARQLHMMDKRCQACRLRRAAAKPRPPIRFRRIMLGETVEFADGRVKDLDHGSKLDHSRSLIMSLMRHGADCVDRRHRGMPPKNWTPQQREQMGGGAARLAAAAVGAARPTVWPSWTGLPLLAAVRKLANRALGRAR
jgi:NTE family protein